MEIDIGSLLSVLGSVLHSFLDFFGYFMSHMYSEVVLICYLGALMLQDWESHLD